VSADGERWVLLNASPDLPHQIFSTPCLWPRAGATRHSPIEAVVISGGDVDCIAGLLSLRECQALAVYADAFVQKIFDENTIFRVLDRRIVRFSGFAPGQITGADGMALGLAVEAFAVAGKVPLYQETSDDIARLSAADAVVGLGVSDGASRIFYVPGCAAVTDELRGRLRAGDVLFFDGTLWRDDEMILAGTGTKNGARMGHMSISGPGGSIAAFAGVEGVRKIFIHINNTNPILCDNSDEAAFVRGAGWEIAYDGMALRL
jgi:pyrroloquinoline quinone biosynthesis protein B